MNLCQTNFVAGLSWCMLALLTACAQESPDPSPPVRESARLQQNFPPPPQTQSPPLPLPPTPVLPGREIAPGVRLLGRLGHPRLSESSGVAASRLHPGVLWTHNDGGGGRKQALYAVNREGATLAEFLVTDVVLIDWEDIALDGENQLYLADVGNNDLKRQELAVYQLPEPSLTNHSVSLQTRRSWRLRFPGQPFDCESLFVWKGYGYVVSKVLGNAHAQIFRFPLEQPQPAAGEAAPPESASTVSILELVATTRIDSPVTGADLSPDGNLLGLVAKSGAYVLRVRGDPTRAGKVKSYQTRFRHEHIEACTFVPEGLLATAESREIYLFTDPPFRGNTRGRDPE